MCEPVWPVPHTPVLTTSASPQIEHLPSGEACLVVLMLKDDDTKDGDPCAKLCDWYLNKTDNLS